MNKKVIYTAIFGGYDKLPDPTFIPEGWDFVCFTDSDIQSDVWEIKKVPAIYEDPTRNARKYKVLPHRWFPDYEYSLWVDGNIIVRDNVNELITQYLSDVNLAVHDHNQNQLDPRDCVYTEAEVIFYFGKKNGSYKDDPTIINKQIQRYVDEGYPEHNSLAVTMQVLRRHNESDCITAMEQWWEEIVYNSKRDQLSFNYSMWKTQMKFNYFNGDSRDNVCFLNTGKHKKKDVKVSEGEFSPIDIDYFLNMEVQHGGGGKEVCHQHGQLKTVRDVVKYWQNEENVEAIQSSLNPGNWQYFNSMMAGFKEGVITEDGPETWKILSKQYYDSLPDMSEEEIEESLRDDPVGFDNGYIQHGTHRAYAMIGRLIKKQKYLPLWMKTSQIYNEPRKKCGTHRAKPLTNNVKGIKELMQLGIRKDEFIIVQSGILSVMNIRQNNDLDIIISPSARKRLFNNNQQFIRLSNDIEIFAPNYGKFMKFGATNDDDLIKNYALIIDGYRFLQPRFYFQRLFRDSEKDKSDWPGVRRFFKLEKYKCYPYNTISLDEWGYEWQ